ncbi:MAG: alpha-galactosidase, partial [Oscillospiraceae bacterium]|nr:alpha-galactosidase [Oscillospiraceae bacterium]
KNSSYIFGILKNKVLVHLHWGNKINDIGDVERMLWKGGVTLSATDIRLDGEYSTDKLMTEYPTYGNTDLRSPAFHAKYENGSRTTQLDYIGYKITKGKPALQGLPAVYAENDSEADTLEVELKDDLTGMSVFLSYTVFNEIDAIIRSTRVVNNGSENITLSRVLSASVDFEDNEFDMLHLRGAWTRERHVQRIPLLHGTQTVDSKRGASSAQHNPFVALLRKDATEDKGEVYGMNFVYSGNFIAGAEVDQFFTTRMFMGINPFDFGWNLEPGCEFQAPEVVMVHSSEGLGGMSREYHKLYRTRLCRGKYRDERRPILINNWEATYFNFDEDKILDITKRAKSIGIELMVLDDGWFGKRDDATTSLGDWVVDKRKLPNGIDGLAKKVNEIGLKFGLWFEPEMISVDSDLYRAHPDWCIHQPGRNRDKGRQQLMLDLSRDEICDYIIDALSKVLSSAPISYVKWDYNRNMTTIGSAGYPAKQQSEVAHRYILGLYKVLEALTSKFPEILFESCSSGGGRYDPGMLYYMPQTWASDDTDAIERLYIQYGTSICYPASSMGAHVSIVPNHLTHRVTPLKTRGHVAMMGTFGYELDLALVSDEDMAEAKEQVTFFKSISEIIHKGDMYRLKSPFDSDFCFIQYISEDKSQVALFSCHKLMMPNPVPYFVKMTGLDPDAVYVDRETGVEYGGDYLMNIGVKRSPYDDFVSEMQIFVKK